MPPYASIIMPTRNVGDKFDIVLRAISNSKVDFDYEIIVVDSGSTDNTKEIISKYPVKLIEISTSSFSHGGSRNLGAHNAKGEILVYLTGDAVPKDENWLSNLTKHFKDKSVTGVYGRQLPDEDSTPLEKFFLHYIYPDHKIVKDSINPDNCIVQDILFSDVNSAMRKSEWENHNFSENLIMSEDSAWGRATLLRGKRIVYEPEAAVYHCHNYSPLGVMKRNFDSGLSLRGLVKAPLRRSLGYEIIYLKSGSLHFLRHKLYKYLLVFPLYEAFRLFGFFMGFHSKFLPTQVKKALSRNKIYWE